MIRNFRLQNKTGSVLDLNDTKHFAFNPNGLGVSKSNSYYQSGSYFIPSSSDDDQGILEVDMLIGLDDPKPYVVFKEFSEFILKPPFKLVYETDAGLFHRDCLLSKMEKSEVKEGFAFFEPFSLEFTSPWYKVIKLKTTSDSAEFNIGAYGFIFSGVTPILPPPNNLILDPELSNLSALENILPQPVTYLKSVPSQYIGDFNELVFNGSLQPSVTFNFKTDMFTSPYDTCVMSCYYKSEVSSSFLIDIRDYTGDANSIKFIVDGLVYPVEETEVNTRFLVKTPDTFKIGYKKLSLVFLEPILEAPRITWNNAGGYGYMTQPKLYVGALESSNATHFTFTEVSPVFSDANAPDLAQFGRADINNESQDSKEGSPVIISIPGPATNPEWHVYKNGVEVQNDKYLLSLAIGETLVVSSNPTDPSALRYDTYGNVENVYQFQDQTKSNFVTIPSGQCSIIFEGITNNVDLEYREENSIV